jgi:hypothetical protein
MSLSWVLTDVEDRKLVGNVTVDASDVTKQARLEKGAQQPRVSLPLFTNTVPNRAGTGCTRRTPFGPRIMTWSPMQHMTTMA